LGLDRQVQGHHVTDPALQLALSLDSIRWQYLHGVSAIHGRPSAAALACIPAQGPFDATDVLVETTLLDQT
jgi:hypothetical protein